MRSPGYDIVRINSQKRHLERKKKRSVSKTSKMPRQDPFFRRINGVVSDFLPWTYPGAEKLDFSSGVVLARLQLLQKLFLPVEDPALHVFVAVKP